MKPFNKVQALESLQRAQSSQSLHNQAAIIRGFTERGIPAAEIIPTENTFTYAIWQALGYQVQKGEKGVKIVSIREDDKTGKKYPASATVFHISQTKKIEG